MNKYNEQYQPLYEEITIKNLDNLIDLLSSKTDLMVLHSAKIMANFGRYSFICFDSFASFRAKNNDFFWNNDKIVVENPFSFLMDKIAHYRIKKNDDLPPLQGGMVGYFGYEAGHYLETLPYLTDYIDLPDIYLNFYSNIIAIDHVAQQSWIIATGFPEKNNHQRLIKAKAAIVNIKELIMRGNQMSSNHKLSHEKIANTIASNFDLTRYSQAVLKTQQYILNGDIFQANISQQFNITISNKYNRLALYFKLMQLNPAPFSALIKLPNNSYIVSASPERFIKLSNQLVETCPIKGTCKRSSDPMIDQALAQALVASEKDRAENIMIVDLMRNDLSRVCQPGSIQVTELCALKSFATVHHLVSNISGQLKDHMTALDVLQATFPPGSVTGAPKIRAMEIISELEKQTRGPYCGSMGYISFTGDMDTSVVIRSYFINNNQLFYSAGGAVVLDSQPDEEYLESMTKANSLLQALTQ